MDNLYGAALRLTRDQALAEDLVQDSMVRAYRFWDSFKPGTSVKAWLFTILRNTFINGYHKRNRARNFKADVEQQMGSLGSNMALGQPGGELPSPEEAVSATVTRARIMAALDSIPEDYRTAVMLADLEGMAYKEIAEIMDCPIGTVMSRIYRGRRLLHKLLFDHAAEVGLIDPDVESPGGSRAKAASRGPAKDGHESSSDNGPSAAERTRNEPISLIEFREQRGTA